MPWKAGESLLLDCDFTNRLMPGGVSMPWKAGESLLLEINNYYELTVTCLNALESGRVIVTINEGQNG